VVEESLSKRKLGGGGIEAAGTANIGVPFGSAIQAACHSAVRSYPSKNQAMRCSVDQRCRFTRVVVAEFL
jgi:hypothetical protein